ncbi:hypothetical protein FGO68_gene12990 [Halteria grandinella]|uniref:Uncharacterized protein n=1 Tax=Halteria grandinella TaxID=5974 RepID=A0A8J8SVJ9_HALGN|nr:hypothetical protein FGO68_gene12990 [Halteria grandinella]
MRQMKKVITSENSYPLIIIMKAQIFKHEQLLVHCKKSQSISQYCAYFRFYSSAMSKTYAQIAYSTIQIKVAIRHSLVARIPQPTEASAAQIQHQVIETIIQIPGQPYETSNYKYRNHNALGPIPFSSIHLPHWQTRIQGTVDKEGQSKLNQKKIAPSTSSPPHPRRRGCQTCQGKLPTPIQNTYSSCTQNLELSYCQTQNSLTLDR